MSSIRTLGAAALLAVLAGCSSAPPAPSSSDNGPPPANGLDLAGEGKAPPIDHPALDPSKRPVTSAQPTRLSVAQLRNALPVTLGKDDKGVDITWLIGKQPGLDVMSRTLGEPDWSVVTAEDLTPSPLYLKLMDDAARDVCKRVLDADATRADKKARTILRFVAPDDTDPKAAPIAENARYLKLRFHGVHVDPTDDATVAPLVSLFSAGVATQKTASAEVQARAGWNLVCVALLTAPEFHLY